ncbi:MAG: hypothetical protein ACLR5I_00090 [Odoribacter splanchnicus]
MRKAAVQIHNPVSTAVLDDRTTAVPLHGNLTDGDCRWRLENALIRKMFRKGTAVTDYKKGSERLPLKRYGGGRYRKAPAIRIAD